jgi:hypothetical protein
MGLGYTDFGSGVWMQDTFLLLSFMVGNTEEN